jgi:Domain of unknown function (DUF4381)
LVFPLTDRPAARFRRLLRERYNAKIDVDQFVLARQFKKYRQAWRLQGPHPPGSGAAAITELLKRTALAACPRTEVATLSGVACGRARPSRRDRAVLRFA